MVTKEDIELLVEYHLASAIWSVDVLEALIALVKHAGSQAKPSRFPRGGVIEDPLPPRAAVMKQLEKAIEELEQPVSSSRVNWILLGEWSLEEIRKQTLSIP